MSVDGIGYSEQILTGGAMTRRTLQDLLALRAQPEPDPAVGMLDCRYEGVPLQRGIVRSINEAIAAEDPETRDRKKKEADARLEEFHRSNGAGHSTPAWIRPTMDFVLNNLLGDKAIAEARGVEALRAARTPWQVAISTANLSQLYRQSGRHQQAVAYAWAAVDIDPRNDGFWADLTLALLDGGRIEEARAILRQVEAIADVRSRKSGWRAHLIGYRAHFEKYMDLRELQGLYGAISRGAGE